MKTTVELEPGLLQACKRLAVQEQTTLKSLIEESLRHLLAQRESRSTQGKQLNRLPVSTTQGGVFPGVDLNDSANLEELMKS